MHQLKVWQEPERGTRRGIKLVAAGVVFAVMSVVFVWGSGVLSDQPAEAVSVAQNAASAGLSLPAKEEPTAIASIPDEIVLTNHVVPEPTANLHDVESIRTELLSNPLNGRDAVLASITLINEGLSRLGKVDTYTAEFFKHEAVDGYMSEPQTVEMKVRQEPFGVYMRWLTTHPGRELLYLEGENEGRILVQPGGWRGRILGALNLDPEGSMAMGDSRYPITTAGLDNFAKRVLEYRETDTGRTSGFECEMLATTSDTNRSIYEFVINYATPDDLKEYRKSIVRIDQDLLLPTHVINFSWPFDDTPEGESLDDRTMVEHYRFENVDCTIHLADAEFDQTNEAYAFQRRR
ncbi:DUF1571 domain-containing protein [Calycomorphotria hydatis]|uniref:DUF1571 domain-containing protein n=1 Tax=Calycomorphotria hydatis TaxID=2528027 RepID=A0A517T5X4_9PLAN|nr:DUF1571 domain-containing protein [Calycomorphotria hydatis]QDT63782.1 hypothetical protein V22_10070 [Calycomorphotria hydatis]